MSGLITLREKHHNRLLRARAIESLLMRPSFERLWEDSTPEQQEAAINIIKDFNKEGLLKWVRDHPSIDLGERDRKDLLPIAQRLKIRNYSRLSRMDLIMEITQVENINGAQ